MNDREVSACVAIACGFPNHLAGGTAMIIKRCWERSRRVLLGRFVVLLLAVSIIGSCSMAQIERTISYQGVLTDSLGNPRHDGLYEFTFRLFDAGGTAIWEETKSLQVKKGLFSTLLGDAEPIPPSMRFDKQYWVETKVGDEVLAPRLALSCAGYSLFALASPADEIWRVDGSNVFRVDGNIGIGTNNPTARLDVHGLAKTQVLEITGGSDLAEPFEISDEESLPPGTVVVIDNEHPGKLKQSTHTYDKRVAGIISGAGGIRPGLTLTQQGDFCGAQHVALTGRVYVRATTINGPIEPGDMLTSSPVPGHAMKATDKENLIGTVIGKAMSSLIHHEGLVLVLVNLQ